jgi:hypothetical protein
MINLNDIRLKYHEFVFQAVNAEKSLKLVDGFSNIVLENNPEKYITTLPNLKIINDKNVPYFLQHSDLLENAKKIFEICFGQEADLLMVSCIKSDYSKCYFVVTNRSFIHNVFNDKANKVKSDLLKLNQITDVLEIINTEKRIRELTTIQANESNLEITLPKEIFPVIGVFNDVEFKENPNFNLIFGGVPNKAVFDIQAGESEPVADAPAKKIDLIKIKKNSDDATTQNKASWIFEFDKDIQPKFGFGIPLYCIKKFDLHNYDYFLKEGKLEDWLKAYDPDNMELFYEKVRPSVAECFVKQIVKIMVAYNRSAFLKLNSLAFEAFIADFFELDRTPSTVKRSNLLQKKLRTKFRQASVYAKKIEHLKMTHFIHFFILESTISFAMFKADPVKSIKKAMAEKYETQKLIGKREILSSFLNKSNPNEEYNTHLADQIEARSKIINLL